MVTLGTAGACQWLLEATISGWTSTGHRDMLMAESAVVRWMYRAARRSQTGPFGSGAALRCRSPAAATEVLKMFGG